MALHRHCHCLLKEPTMALELPSSESQTEKPVITQLEAGQTIEVEGPAQGLAGMVEVRRQGRTYAVFLGI